VADGVVVREPPALGESRDFRARRVDAHERVIDLIEDGTVAHVRGAHRVEVDDIEVQSEREDPAATKLA
jgi:hypothetical protein